MAADGNGSTGGRSQGDQHSGSSEGKIHANQRNAQKSTGPRTPEGKDRSSQNARKHGLAGVVPITTGDAKEDLAAFEEMRAGLYAYWNPEGWQEEHLVELLAGDYFRLHRADRYEAGMTRKFSDHATHKWQLRRISSFHTDTITAGAGLWNAFFSESVRGVDYQVAFLERLSNGIEQGYGVDESISPILMGLFGGPGLLDSFALQYRLLYERIQQCQKAKKQDAAAEYMKQLRQEIATLIKNLQEKRREVEIREKTEVDAELLSVSLPPWELLDRLSRYTTTIRRRIDRAVTQLEHLQKVREEKSEPAPTTAASSAVARDSQSPGQAEEDQNVAKAPHDEESCSRPSPGDAPTTP